MFNLQLIFGNQYLEDLPQQKLVEADAPVVPAASEINDPCCSAAKKSDCCKSTP